MQLIERYLHAIGRQLPLKERADILAELRSQILDTLEARVEGEAQDSDVEAVLKEMGTPRVVAASYYPNQQYLIGPQLFPLFRMVAGIVFAATVGAQLLVALISMLSNPGGIHLLDTFWGIINSLPVSLGFLVITFYFLQRFDVNPELDNGEEFDPQKLPHVGDTQPIKRGEHIFSIVMGVVIFVFLAQFSFAGGFSNGDATNFFNNPVIAQYLPWIGLSILAGILIDLWLLWRGGWQTSIRIARLLANVFSLVVLGLLVQEHNIWLGDTGISLLESIVQIPVIAGEFDQFAGMVIFRFALTIAFVVTAIETVVQLFRLVRNLMQANTGQELPLVNAQ